jgi:hypothetical protein
MKRLHRNPILTTVFLLIALRLEGKVVLDWSTRVASFLVDARRHGGCNSPKDHEYGDSGEDSDEKPCPETTSEVPGNVGWDHSEEGEEEEVIEGVAAWAVGWERCILDCWVLKYTYQCMVIV